MSAEPAGSRPAASKMTFRQFLTSRRSITAVVATLLAGSAVAAYRANGAADAPDASNPTPPLPVEVVTLAWSDGIEVERAYTGQLVARRSSRLAFERPGRVQQMLVDDGDRVSADQVLAHLSSRGLRAQRDELVAQRDAAAARLREMIAGPRVEQIAAARADVAEREANLAFWMRESERLRKLTERGATSEREYADALSRRDQAFATRDAAKERLAELEAGTRQEQIDAQRAAVAQLDAAIVGVDVDLDKVELRAPFDGVIARRFIDEGSVVDAGTDVLDILEANTLEARIGLPVEALRSVELDARYSLRIGAQSVEARLTAIMPRLDVSTRTSTVIFEIDNAYEKQLRSGQMARLTLKQPIDESGYWVPIDALVRGERGLWTIYAARQQSDARGAVIAERRDVEVLHAEADRALVRGLLSTGERVVASGVHRLAPGQRIQPQPYERAQANPVASGNAAALAGAKR